LFGKDAALNADSLLETARRNILATNDSFHQGLVRHVMKATNRMTRVSFGCFRLPSQRLRQFIYIALLGNFATVYAPPMENFYERDASQWKGSAFALSILGW
jgi:hypothetical protein